MKTIDFNSILAEGRHANLVADGALEICFDQSDNKKKFHPGAGIRDGLLAAAALAGGVAGHGAIVKRGGYKAVGGAVRDAASGLLSGGRVLAKGYGKDAISAVKSAAVSAPAAAKSAASSLKDAFGTGAQDIADRASAGKTALTNAIKKRRIIAQQRAAGQLSE